LKKLLWKVIELACGHVQTNGGKSIAEVGDRKADLAVVSEIASDYEIDNAADCDQMWTHALCSHS